MAKITGLTYQLLRVKLSITMVVPTEITAPSIPNIPIPFMVYHPIIKNGLLEISTFLPIIFPIKPPFIDDFPIFSQSNLPFCPYFRRFPQFFGDFGCSNSGDRIPGSPDPRIQVPIGRVRHGRIRTSSGGSRKWIWCRVAGAASWSRNPSRNTLLIRNSISISMY